jgi:glucose/arabinose dehydrogenase
MRRSRATLVAEGTDPTRGCRRPRQRCFRPSTSATAKGWPANAKPVAAEGLVVARFPNGLDHPRWVYVLPNGDVLVAESNAPPRPDDARASRPR